MAFGDRPIADAPHFRPLVLCPLAAEASALRRPLVRAGLGAARVLITGMGSACAEVARTALLGDSRPSLVVLVGTAGGLADTPPALIAEEIVDADGRLLGRTFVPLTNAEGPGRRRIAGLTGPVSSIAAKARLAAASGAVACDMESAEVLGVCRQAGVPLAVVRGISDGPHDALPREVLGFVDLQGRTRPGQVLATIIRRPELLAVLLPLARRTRHAMAEAAELVVQVLHAHQRGASAAPPAATTDTAAGPPADATVDLDPVADGTAERGRP
jgi:adenosylhomocysteine nucleosidase